MIFFAFSGPKNTFKLLIAHYFVEKTLSLFHNLVTCYFHSLLFHTFIKMLT